MFCSVHKNTYQEVVTVAKRAYLVIQKAMELYPNMCHSQKELIRFWDDTQVTPAVDDDDDAPPTRERLSHFLKNSYIDITDILAAVKAQDVTLIEIWILRTEDLANHWLLSLFKHGLGYTQLDKRDLGYTQLDKRDLIW